MQIRAHGGCNNDTTGHFQYIGQDHAKLDLRAAFEGHTTIAYAVTSVFVSIARIPMRAVSDPCHATITIHEARVNSTVPHIHRRKV